MGIGLRLDDVGRCSLPQAMILLEMHTANKKQEFMGLLGLHRVAFHADAKGMKEYAKQLESED